MGTTGSLPVRICLAVVTYFVATCPVAADEPEPGESSVRVRNVKVESLKLFGRRSSPQTAEQGGQAEEHHAERDANTQERSIWRRPQAAQPVSFAKDRRDGDIRQTAGEPLQLASPGNHGEAPVRHVSRLREFIRRPDVAPYQQQPGDEDPMRNPLDESFAQGPSSPFDCPEKSELTRPIRELTLEMYDEHVKECPLFYETYTPRYWQCLTFYWKASAVCHKPLYFEEVALERYGHSTGPFTEPFVSGAHFFACVVTLPYKMGINHPCECMYPLGYYRPGDCAPKLIYPLPLSARGALYQGAAVTGLVFLIP